MAETAEHRARPTKIMEASVANVIMSHPATIGMVMDIMVRRLPKMEHMGEERGALSIATNGTMEPESKQRVENIENCILVYDFECENIQ